MLTVLILTIDPGQQEFPTEATPQLFCEDDVLDGECKVPSKEMYILTELQHGSLSQHARPQWRISGSKTLSSSSFIREIFRQALHGNSGMHEQIDRQL